MLETAIGNGVRRMEMEMRRGGDVPSVLASTSSVSWSSLDISPRTSSLVGFSVGPNVGQKKKPNVKLCVFNLRYRDVKLVRKKHTEFNLIVWVLLQQIIRLEFLQKRWHARTHAFLGHQKQLKFTSSVIKQFCKKKKKKIIY